MNNLCIHLFGTAEPDPTKVDAESVLAKVYEGRSGKNSGVRRRMEILEQAKSALEGKVDVAGVQRALGAAVDPAIAVQTPVGKAPEANPGNLRLPEVTVAFEPPIQGQQGRNVVAPAPAGVVARGSVGRITPPSTPRGASSSSGPVGVVAGGAGRGRGVGAESRDRSRTVVPPPPPPPQGLSLIHI